MAGSVPVLSLDRSTIFYCIIMHLYSREVERINLNTAGFFTYGGLRDKLLSTFHRADPEIVNRG